jgi:hypothetical protein
MSLAYRLVPCWAAARVGASHRSTIERADGGSTPTRRHLQGGQENGHEGEKEQKTKAEEDDTDHGLYIDEQLSLSTHFVTNLNPI